MKLIVPAILCCAVSLLSFKVKAQTGNGNSSDRMFFRAKLYAANGNIADGNMVAFDDDFTNAYDVNDAIKFLNPGENFGMRRDGRLLAIEARYTLCATDTIFYDIRNLAQQTYQIKFAPQYMGDVTLMAILQDKFTGGQTLVSLKDSTFFFFTITSNPASRVQDRFRVVFLDAMAAASVLPVKFTYTALKQQSKGRVNINWDVVEQQNVKYYLVERGSNGSSFRPVGEVAAKAAIAGKASYTYDDITAVSSEKFYRITSVDIDGKLSYSKIIKINDDARLEAQMSIWPNPLTTPQLQVKISGTEKGIYAVAVSNQLGQQVHSSKLTITADTQQFSLNLGSSLAKGRYTVVVTGSNGTIMQQSLLVQ